MKYYQELTLIPHAEISPYFLWSKIYTQLHLAFVEMKDGQDKVPFGVSFPQYVNRKDHYLLGRKLRVFSESHIELETLNLEKWLARLNDYVHRTSIRDVPSRVDSYAIYQRYQPKINSMRLARRYAKRHQIPLEEALRHYADSGNRNVKLPYIHLRSLNNNNSFNLFIDKKQAASLTNQGFGTYGLSSQSSVPEF